MWEGKSFARLHIPMGTSALSLTPKNEFDIGDRPGCNSLNNEASRRKRRKKASEPWAQQWPKYKHPPKPKEILTIKEKHGCDRTSSKLNVSAHPDTLRTGINKPEQEKVCRIRAPSPAREGPLSFSKARGGTRVDTRWGRSWWRSQRPREVFFTHRVFVKYVYEAEAQRWF